MEADEYTVQLGMMFGQAMANSTAEWVNTKLEEAKLKKGAQEKEIAYKDIINGLLEKNLELEGIARQYKALYEKVTISDEDIDYLHKTMEQAIEVISSFDGRVKQNENSIRALTQLVNKDVLKTMQMLGFNYKEAIGEPLTEACSNAIVRNLGGKSNNQSNKRKNN